MKTPFLHGSINEEIYMFLPEGYRKKGVVCKLKKSLYGLKQASNRWDDHLATCMEVKGFKNESGSIIIALHVDDGYILYRNDAEILDLFTFLQTKFEMKRVEDPELFLGLPIGKTELGIKICQKDFTLKVLQKFGMDDAKSVSVPINDVSHDDLANTDATYPYREAVGSL